MDQTDKKLDDLVEKVDQEARAYVSFDDYLASKSPIPNPDNIPGLETARENEWKKPAPDAEGNSSSSSNGKAEGKDESKPLASAEAVSQASEPKEKTWWKENPTPQRPEALTPPATDPNVAWPEANYKPVETVPLTETVLEIKQVEWNGQISTFLSETEQVVPMTEEMNTVYQAGQKLFVADADLFEIIGHFKSVQDKLKKLQLYLESVHNGLRREIPKLNSELRTKAYSELNRSNRSLSTKNKAQAEKIKAARATIETKEAKAPKVKAGAGVKLADMLFANGFKKEVLVNHLRGMGNLDDATIEHINKLYGKQGS